MNRAAIKAIRFYQIFSKSIFRHGFGFLIVQPACRTYPTCSDYAIDAFERYGFFKALGKSLHKVVKCNPWTEPKAIN